MCHQKVTHFFIFCTFHCLSFGLLYTNKCLPCVSAAPPWRTVPPQLCYLTSNHQIILSWPKVKLKSQHVNTSWTSQFQNCYRFGHTKFKLKQVVAVAYLQNNLQVQLYTTKVHQIYCKNINILWVMKMHLHFGVGVWY